MPPQPTPLPLPIRDRPFRVSEALELGVARGRLRGPDLRAPFYGVRTPVSLGWDPLVRARSGVLVVPRGSVVVGLDAVALAGLPSPLEEAELLRRDLEVAVPMALREPRHRTGVRVHLSVPLRTLPLVTEHGVSRPRDEDLWVLLCAAATSPLRHPDAVRLGLAVLARSDGSCGPLSAAVARAPGPARRRAQRLLDAVLTARA